MVLELKDKVIGTSVAVPVPAQPGWRDTLSQALLGLGFPSSSTDDTVVRLAQAHPDAADADVPDLLREGLVMLGRSR
jgi:Holliday junction resolvasome RuvABC DNA-binding subunit